ncbi:MAG: DUF6441 family protein [Pseudomonadota bacterium]
MLKLSTSVQGNLRLDMETEIKVGQAAALGAVSAVGAAIKGNWRDQIAQAGLGRRLGNSVRSESYPKGTGSLNAAALVWSKAKKIVGAFENGVEIRARNGNWLAIPTPAAGRGNRGGKVMPGEWEKRTGRRLRFVYRPGRSSLLVDDGTVARGARVLGRDGFSKPARGFRNRTVVVFVLVPRVRLQKRLGLISGADRIANSMGARLVSGWRD